MKKLFVVSVFSILSLFSVHAFSYRSYALANEGKIDYVSDSITNLEDFQTYADDFRNNCEVSKTTNVKSMQDVKKAPKGIDQAISDGLESVFDVLPNELYLLDFWFDSVRFQVLVWFDSDGLEYRRIFKLSYV